MADRIRTMATNYRPDAESVSKFADESPGLRAFKPANDQQRKNAAPPVGPGIRSYRLLDSPAIVRLPFRYELHHPESDADQPHTVQLVTRKLVSGEHFRRPLFVLPQGGTRKLAGALQCQQQGADDRWYLQYLSTAESVETDTDVPLSLFEHAIAEAGWSGARRLMARSAPESALTGALRAAGFSAFCHENVYTARSAPTGGSRGMVRVQESSDVWGIHQLYLQTTPRDVQNAEALTSHEWDVDLEGRSRRGWFIASEGVPTAYVRVRTSRRCYRLDAMFVPKVRSQLAALFNAVFAVLRAESARPIFIAIRGYQQELESVVEGLGFRLEADQLMMVRYTTVPVPARTTEGFELLQARESDPQRVPSFYVREPHE